MNNISPLINLPQLHLKYSRFQFAKGISLEHQLRSTLFSNARIITNCQKRMTVYNHN